VIPAKPFPNYKWHWLSVQPSESLLQAPIFLGVLRTLARHEGEAFSTNQLRDDLAVVEADTHSPVRLARAPDRNLFRNSGQYWRGTGLLTPTRGVIALTNLGRRVASGRVTQGEFAALMVRQTVLPNPETYSPEEIAQWRAAGLEIRPLKLILEVIEELGRRHGGVPASWLSNEELTLVVIPLAGAKTTVPTIAEYVVRYRRDNRVVQGWPDCIPAANDHRLAKEFLLFLANFGFLRKDDAQRFHLDELFDVEAAASADGTSMFEGEANAEKAVEEARHSPLPSIVERQRVLAQILARPGQSRFRGSILKASGGQCLLTGETMTQVLEAAHIVPVEHGGADERDNGFCMRVDIHRLYDSGNIRIAPSGAITFSEAVTASQNYKTLPKLVKFPECVNDANVSWRDRYL
jgi:hypothetical protein